MQTQNIAPKLTNPTNLNTQLERLRLLQLVGEELDLTESQQTTAKKRYETVGSWIANSQAPELYAAAISPQGSVALGTTTKPIGISEFDVDLICLIPSVGPHADPSFIKRVVGNRLRENATYAKILEEKRRCWRLNYAGEFHLDITPTIPNPGCNNGGELVPDKALANWKPTNPKGYRKRFEYYASLVPQFIVQYAEALTRATVEPLPEIRDKTLLQLIVQICKRHRDICFVEHNTKFAPISIIITTLAAWSYKRCVLSSPYDSELDLFIDVVEMMPQFIQTQDVDGRTNYFIPNETTSGENFADKWNIDPRLASAFYKWHKALMTSLSDVQNLRGTDQLGRSLATSFGENISTNVIERLTKRVTMARKDGGLFVAPGLGLSLGSDNSVAVQNNTFFGR